MKAKILNRNVYPRRGFTIIEVLVGGIIMLAIILATLALYSRSNKISVDQTQLAELQHDVRAAMYFISRDIKSIGAGLSPQFSSYFLGGDNNDKIGGAPIETDRLTILGNSDPLRLVIESFDPGQNIITIQPNEFDLYPYTATNYPADPIGYINRAILVLPNPDLLTDHGELGRITDLDMVANTITFDRIQGKLPRSLDLSPGGNPADYVGGTVNFVEVRTYWLDVDGSYPGCNPGVDGYIGQPAVLYVSQWNTINSAYEHLPLAQNIEDLQFQYHGDMDDDQQLDDNNSDGVINVNDFLNWGDGGDKNFNWNDDLVVAGIRSIRVLVLGKTPNPFVSFSGIPTGEQEIRTYENIYGKPAVADSPEGDEADKHRRFLLESTINVRNMSLNVYNNPTT